MGPKKWSDAETATLIGIYGDYFGTLEKMAKKKPIHERISAKLKENGYERDAGQVAKKISNLREDYKKKKPGPTGDERPVWIHFEALHKILHERPCLNPDVAVTSEIGLPIADDAGSRMCDDGGGNMPNGLDEIENEEVCSRPPSSLSVEGPSRKKSRLSEQTLKLCSETMEFMKLQAAKRDAEREELKQTNASLVAALNRIATSSESIAESIKQGNVAIYQAHAIPDQY